MMSKETKKDNLFSINEEYQRGEISGEEAMEKLRVLFKEEIEEDKLKPKQR